MNSAFNALKFSGLSHACTLGTVRENQLLICSMFEAGINDKQQKPRGDSYSRRSLTLANCQ